MSDEHASGKPMAKVRSLFNVRTNLPDIANDTRYEEDQHIAEKMAVSGRRTSRQKASQEAISQPSSALPSWQSAKPALPQTPPIKAGKDGLDDESINHRNQSEPRSARLIRLHMVHPEHGLVEANVRNVSAHGMGGVTDTQLSVGDRLDLCLKDGKSMRAEVRWTRQEGKRTAFGLRSEGVLQPASFAAKGDGKDWDRTVIKPLDENHVFARYRPMKTAKRPGFGRRI